MADSSDEAMRVAAVVQRWVGPALGIVLALTLALTFSHRSGRFLLPFPWQDNQLAAVERQLRHSLYLKIDRAAKTYFLVEIHYPGSLDELAAWELISQADLRDQAGGRLTYSTDDVSYRIVPLRDGSRDQDLATTEAITGDFLLDPQFLRPPSSDAPALVLLD